MDLWPLSIPLEVVLEQVQIVDQLLSLAFPAQDKPDSGIEPDQRYLHPVLLFKFSYVIRRQKTRLTF